ncbi:hypothetical protein FRB94_008054 [Tulasnella sp. JGI-2019a]|nr:hypothetical protein FRB93_003682 [Tulasnella sp. JGI-2019a]KAG8996759.1 hypothetical protein FRB94_008054 [Tulasnella sp. JGI-2019a]
MNEPGPSKLASPPTSAREAPLPGGRVDSDSNRDKTTPTKVSSQSWLRLWKSKDTADGDGSRPTASPIQTSKSLPPQTKKDTANEGPSRHTSSSPFTMLSRSRWQLAPQKMGANYHRWSLPSKLSKAYPATIQNHSSPSTSHDN